MIKTIKCRKTTTVTTKTTIDLNEWTIMVHAESTGKCAGEEVQFHIEVRRHADGRFLITAVATLVNCEPVELNILAEGDVWSALKMMRADLRSQGFTGDFVEQAISRCSGLPVVGATAQPDLTQWRRVFAGRASSDGEEKYAECVMTVYGHDNGRNLVRCTLLSDTYVPRDMGVFFAADKDSERLGVDASALTDKIAGWIRDDVQRNSPRVWARLIGAARDSLVSLYASR